MGPDSVSLDIGWLDARYASKTYVSTLETRVATLESKNAALEEKAAALENRIAAIEALLKNVTRNGNDIYVTGANLHIRNGNGGTGTTPNGLGNLIIGYNESSSSTRTGSASRPSERKSDASTGCAPQRMAAPRRADPTMHEPSPNWLSRRNNSRYCAV